MRMWRTHPIRFAALLGALFGLAMAMLIELGGILHWNSSAAILMLLPSPRFGFGFSEARLLPTVLFVFIETIANVLVYAFLFSAPVALIVGIRALASGR